MLPYLSRRLQAATLSVALAIGASLPVAGATAQEIEHEGTAAPELTGPDSLNDPDFDPGGPDSILPYEVEIPGGGGAEDEGSELAPVEPEPIEPELPAVPLEDGSNVVSPAPDPAPVTPVPDPVAPAPTPAPALPPAASAPVPAASDPAPKSNRRDGRALTERRRAKTAPAAAKAHEPTSVASPPSASPTVAAPAPISTAPVSSEPASASRETTPLIRDLTGRFYVVQNDPRESLSAIAADLLGAGASAAEIETEWHGLYSENREVIGSDPNIIRPGMKLQLPLRG